MSHPALSKSPLTATAVALVQGSPVLVGVAIVCLIGANFVSLPWLDTIMLTSGVTLLLMALVLHLLAARKNRAQKALFSAVSHFVEQDASPSFSTDHEGMIGYQNKSATAKFGDKSGEALIGVLGGLFASPSAVLRRLQSRAELKGAAQEDVVMRRGHLRLAVHQIGEGGFLWRLEDIADRTGVGRGGDGISIPMLTVSKSNTVLFMNDALRRLIGGREAALDRIILDLPLRPNEVHEISTLDGVARATVVEIESSAGRRELYLVPALDPKIDVGWNFFDSLPVPLLKMGSEGEILMANRQARDLLEFQNGEALSFGELVEGLGRPVVDWLADTIDGRGLSRPEFLRASKPAQEVYIQVSLGRFEDADGVSVVAVLNDATELKTLEAQFVQSQKMQAIGQLAGGVAHDFNNLLTAISGHCDLLLLRHEESDPDFADLEQINQNANRAASLVGQLLAFSRKQNLQPQMLDLRDTMADLTHLLNRLVGERINLTLSHDPTLKMVRADKRQLEQVLMNLVVNARDAMPDGGNIEIETRMSVLDDVLERDRAVVPAGEYVIVRVQDEGIGIAPDKLPKIFEPFFTTKKTGEGTGLGLSTAYGIVKQTGGFIFADSALGSGTCFTLYLPAHEKVEDTAPADVAPPPRPIVTQGEGVVLLVEDEAPVRAFASRALRMRGYTVVEAANAEEALDALEDGSLDVDVFVTDVIMPGMDGPSWVSKALEARPDTRVVFVSGYAEDSIAESQSKIPNSVFLPKPFSLSELTATVQAQLH